MSRLLLLYIGAYLLLSTSANSQDTLVKNPNYGIRQIDQLLDDRPDMKHVLVADHPLVKWIAERFETGAIC